ncbi:AraC family transcriptional regulator [Carboxylicivirga sp. N1Y90]|uniref:AraC family transcriptional regulator n=1 Tax=Carboxylicivirga fragile TaxID=3417571 RepID=UPI003D3551AF|nr:helix-turn-helix domain-containing protein [Marinilabiliaceae bacterium N1Y90]
MADTHFKLNAFLDNEKEAFHVARTTISSQNDLRMHKHGFAEVFWIKSGRGIHVINGNEIPIEKGTLCLVRPEDNHTFKLSKSKDNLVITNIAFYKESLSCFRNRYFPNSKSYFWSTDQLPFTVLLDTDQLNELSAITDRLLSQSRNYLNLDSIMIHIFKLISKIESNQEHLPHWLAYALENFVTPELLKEGTPAFVNLTQRSVDHVNRVLKKHLKQTLTETIIKARLQHASQQLIMTNSSIKSICYSCGFDSISYFYRTYKKYTGLTPAEYRKKNHKVF